MEKIVNKWGEPTPVGPPKPQNTKSSWHTMIGGNPAKDELYKNKYLKYKNKYLKHK